jgi:hypothetical protein
VGIDKVLQSLQPYAYGWRTELPKEARFFGHPIELRLDTRAVPARKRAPRPSEAEIELIRLILSGLRGVLREAVCQYALYNVDVPELFGKIHKPRMWISREWLGDTPPGEWALISGISDAPDWGIHIVFHSLEFYRIWSAD